MSDEKWNFGQRLRFVRELREMDQAEVARAMGVDPAVISHMEAGRRTPGASSLRALCKALTVSADYMLGLSERVSP